MKYSVFLALVCISFIALQCAKQTAPTGGPKDEIPPTLIKSNPAHEETNFKGKEIQLTFDEQVQISNPREQIIITPSIGKKFEATAKKNKIRLELNAPLQANTTYNINFRESILDLTEKNPGHVTLAISTGPYIDSLSINGKIKDALTEKVVANYTVALAQASDTFNIFKHQAAWITLTTKKGTFVLENLKPGTYFIYAFDDKNKNLIVDSKSEKYAFKGDNVILEKNIDSLQLSAFKLDASKLKLISSRPTFAYFDIRLSKSLVDYKISCQDKSEKIYSMLESDLSTIKVFNTIHDLDSLQVRLEAVDSTDSKVDTLIYVKFQKKKSTQDKFSGKIESVSLYENESLLSGIISFSKPVVHFLSDSMYIQLDSIHRTIFTKDDYQWNESFTKLSIRKKMEAKAKTSEPPKKDISKKLNLGTGERKSQKKFNELILAKGSIISVENDTASSLSSPIKNIKPEDTALIHAKVETKENFILQILNKNNQVIEEIKNVREYKFENLPGSTYLLRLLIDLNKNGKWDGGDYLSKKEPEPVVFYVNSKNLKDIIVKANWVVGPLLIAY